VGAPQRCGRGGWREQQGWRGAAAGVMGMRAAAGWLVWAGRGLPCVAPFSGCGGKLGRDEQNGCERALVRLRELEHLLPERLVQLLDRRGTSERVRHSTRRQTGALHRGGEGAYLAKHTAGAACIG
jgi:hypothetical protein